MGGASPANDITLTVTSVNSPSGSIKYVSATGTAIGAFRSGFFVDPVRYVSSTAADTNIGLAVYNSYTKELQYTTALDGGVF